VDAGETEPAGQRLVQRGQVGEADQHSRRRLGEPAPVEAVDDPLGAVAATRGEHRGVPRRRPRGRELRDPDVVVAGQVVELVRLLQDVRCGGRLETP